MCYLVLFILVCSGTLLSITLIDYYQHQRDEFLDSVQKSLQCRRLREKLVTMTTMKQVDIGLFSQEVRDLMDCPWRLNLTHRELHRTELWSCCNAYDRLMVTRQNTIQNQSLTYEVERRMKRKVDQALWEMLPQTVPWSKGSLSRCAVVGSGGILQNSSCGAEIDNSDYVIRFNLAPINKSYDVGVKTDLITANPTQINKRYPGLQLNPGPLAEALSVYGHAHLLLPAFSFAFGTSPCFKVYQALRKARPQQKVVFFHPDYLFELGRFWNRRGQRAPRLSTGLMLASTALEICEQCWDTKEEDRRKDRLKHTPLASYLCLLQKVHLYGFWPFPLDLSQNTLPHHYYDNVGPSHFMHAMPEEFLLLLQLHSQGALQLHVGPCTP